eukprot:14795549-Ditylum_brightwellii.AAC.1
MTILTIENWSQSITGLEDTCNNGCSALVKYVLKSDDPLMKVVREMTLPMQKFPLKCVTSPLHTTLDLADEKHTQELCIKPLN